MKASRTNQLLEGWPEWAEFERTGGDQPQQEIPSVWEKNCEIRDTQSRNPGTLFLAISHSLHLSQYNKWNHVHPVTPARHLGDVLEPTLFLTPNNPSISRVLGSAGMCPRPGPFSPSFLRAPWTKPPASLTWAISATSWPIFQSLLEATAASQSGDHQVTSLRTPLGLTTFHHTSSFKPDKLTSPQGLCTHSSLLSEHHGTSVGYHLTWYFLGEVLLGHPSLSPLHPTALTYSLA